MRPAFAGMTGDELRARIDDHFAAMADQERPFTIEGLALALDVGKDTLIRYRKHEPEEHEGSHVYDEHCEAVKRAYRICEGWMAERCHSAKGSPVGAIFTLKCGYGWQETPTRLDIQGGFSMPVDTSAADDD